MAEPSRRAPDPTAPRAAGRLFTRRHAIGLGVGAGLAASAAGAAVYAFASSSDGTIEVWQLATSWKEPRGPHKKTSLRSQASRNAATNRFARTEKDALDLNLHQCSWAPAVAVTVEAATFDAMWEKFSYEWKNPWNGAVVRLYDQRHGEPITRVNVKQPSPKKTPATTELATSTTASAAAAMPTSSTTSNPATTTSTTTTTTTAPPASTAPSSTAPGTTTTTSTTPSTTTSASAPSTAPAPTAPPTTAASNHVAPSITTPSTAAPSTSSSSTTATSGTTVPSSTAPSRTTSPAGSDPNGSTTSTSPSGASSSSTTSPGSTTSSGPPSSSTSSTSTPTPTPIPATTRRVPFLEGADDSFSVPGVITDVLGSTERRLRRALGGPSPTVVNTTPPSLVSGARKAPYVGAGSRRPWWMATGTAGAVFLGLGVLFAMRRRDEQEPDVASPAGPPPEGPTI